MLRRPLRRYSINVTYGVPVHDAEGRRAPCRTGAHKRCQMEQEGCNPVDFYAYCGPFLTVVEEDPALTRVELVDGGGNTGGEGGGGEAFAFLEAL